MRIFVSTAYIITDASPEESIELDEWLAANRGPAVVHDYHQGPTGYTGRTLIFLASFRGQETTEEVNFKLRFSGSFHFPSPSQEPE